MNGKRVLSAFFLLSLFLLVVIYGGEAGFALLGMGVAVISLWEFTRLVDDSPGVSRVLALVGGVVLVGATYLGGVEWFGLAVVLFLLLQLCPVVVGGGGNRGKPSAGHLLVFGGRVCRGSAEPCCIPSRDAGRGTVHPARLRHCLGRRYRRLLRRVESGAPSVGPAGKPPEVCRRECGWLGRKHGRSLDLGQGLRHACGLPFEPPCGGRGWRRGADGRSC